MFVEAAGRRYPLNGHARELAASLGRKPPTGGSREVAARPPGVSSSRTLAWISRCRRLARDYERHARKAAAFPPRDVTLITPARHIAGRKPSAGRQLFYASHPCWRLTSMKRPEGGREVQRSSCQCGCESRRKRGPLERSAEDAEVSEAGTLAAGMLARRPAVCSRAILGP